ncbi:MAG: arsenate reductase ArsC [Gammaproteobacteria bacterium]
MKKSVLFLCTGNSARSQIAEALLKKQASEYFTVFSAVTSPDGIDSRTIDLLERFNVPTRGLRSKSVLEFEGQTFDFVISLCGRARQECGHFPNAGEMIFWDFEDPKTRNGPMPFDATFRELNERLKIFVLVQTQKMLAAK